MIDGWSLWLNRYLVARMSFRWNFSGRRRRTVLIIIYNECCADKGCVGRNFTSINCGFIAKPLRVLIESAKGERGDTFLPLYLRFR